MKGSDAAQSGAAPSVPSEPTIATDLAPTRVGRRRPVPAAAAGELQITRPQAKARLVPRMTTQLAFGRQMASQVTNIVNTAISRAVDAGRATVSDEAVRFMVANPSNELMEAARDELKANKNFMERVKNEAVGELCESPAFRMEAKEELKHEMRAEVKAELEDDMRDEIEAKLKAELQDESEGDDETSDSDSSEEEEEKPRPGRRPFPPRPVRGSS